jgi:hypothetical protein
MRFRNIELVATQSVDTAALARAMWPSDWDRRPDSIRIGPPDAGVATWLDHKWNLWWAAPAFWRDEIVWPNGETIVRIVRPAAAMVYHTSMGTLYTNEPVGTYDDWELATPDDTMALPTLDRQLEQFPLIRPRLPASQWQIETVGTEMYLHRDAQRVRATRRAGSAPTGDPGLSGFWMGVNDYECLIDQELEIVLSATGTVDGVPVGRIEVESMSVDMPIAATTFDFYPPWGARVIHVTGKRRF